LEADEDDLFQLVTLLAAGEIGEEGAATFFRDHIEPLARE
jgi:death-on-curing protein